LKVKSILVSQPKPQTEKSPYFDLAEKYNLKIDFRPFIQVEGLSVKEFRQYKINFEAFTSVIFTSRTAIDHFFRLTEELRYVVPDNLKYFCISESTAFYLQKYITYRKRKIFYGSKKFEELMEIIIKHPEEKYIVPLSDIHKQEIPKLLTKAKINYTKAIMYKTVSSNLSDLSNVNYDILVFFSPSGIKSLMQNFPDFTQNDTKIAAFGTTTEKAVLDANLRLDIKSPIPQAPSMTMALEQFIKKENKKNQSK
jgi:uroporphyrinogen-III synthase